MNRKMDFNFQPGEKVTAKWPGSNLYYPGIVTKLRRDHQYEIKFGDDTFHTIHPRHVHSPSKSPSPSSSVDSRDEWKPNKQLKSGKSGRNSTPTRKQPPRKASKSPDRSGSTGRRGRPRGKSRRSKDDQSLSKSPTKKSNSVTRRLTRSKSPRLKGARSSNRFVEKRIEEVGVKRIKEVGVKRSEDKLRDVGVKRSEDKLRDVGVFTPWEEPDEKDIEDDSFQTEEPFVVSCQRSLLALIILLLTIAFPIFVFWINLTCDRFDCGIGVSKFPENINEYFDWQTLGVFVGWIFFQFILAVLPIGQHAEGQPLIDAQRLSYKLNGLHSLITTLAILSALIYVKISFDFVLDKLLQLITASIITAVVLSFFFFLRATNALFRQLTPGISNNPASGFFFGRELNPRIGDFDLKFFCLLRPSVIGWAVLDVLILYQEYQTSETFYPSIWVVGISQLFYILDAFLFEEAYLSGWNINKEGCGFLLIFSSLCFCPFVYTLSLRFLLLYRPHIENYILIAVVFLNIVGYSIYRVANKQKDDFRRNPYHHKFATAKTIDTKTTRKIFVDGWWKHLRHPNYLGDLLIALSWCLPCGFDYVVPYTYFFYLFLLLTHRAYRDDQACLRKYGDSWVSYCKHVRYRVIPYCY